ncbi:MAG: ABC transporter permease [Sulfurovum sp.]|nr:MAG: ABC transporter permease [Sulfurovum sp.]
MKNIKQKKAFSMIELVFVIVIIGILAAVAIPRLAATRDDAMISKARVLVASVRNALAMERQKRILRGNFNSITAVGGTTYVFGNFDNNSSTSSVLEYPMASEDKKDRWYFSSGTGKSGRDQYIFKSTLGDVAFEVVSGKFECDTAKTNNTNTNGCTQLTN